MNKLFLIPMLFLASCGFNGTQKLETNDSNQTVEQTGSSYTYIIVRLEYLEQIKVICQDANPIEDFETESLQKKAVAACTIENMKLLSINLGQVDNFTDKYCVPGADLSGFTPQQQADIIAACAALGGNDVPTNP